MSIEKKYTLLGDKVLLEPKKPTSLILDFAKINIEDGLRVAAVGHSVDPVHFPIQVGDIVKVDATDAGVTEVELDGKKYIVAYSHEVLFIVRDED